MPRIVAAGVLAAVVVGGGWFVASRGPPLQQVTLAELFDLCAGFAATGDFAPLLPYGIENLDRRWTEKRFAVDGGKVRVVVRASTDGGPYDRCSVEGVTKGDIDNLRDPDLTWRASKDRVAAWFAAREADPDAVKLRVVLAPEDFSLAVCPADGNGYMLGGGSANLMIDLKTAPADDQALSFGAGRSVSDVRLACRMVADVREATAAGGG